MRYAVGHRHKERVRDFGIMHSFGLVKDASHAEARINALSEDVPDRIFFLVEIPDPYPIRTGYSMEVDRSSDQSTEDS